MSEGGGWGGFPAQQTSLVLDHNWTCARLKHAYPTNQLTKAKTPSSDQKHYQEIIKIHKVMIRSGSAGQPDRAKILNMIVNSALVLSAFLFLAIKCPKRVNLRILVWSSRKYTTLRKESLAAGMTGTEREHHIHSQKQGEECYCSTCFSYYSV